MSRLIDHILRAKPAPAIYATLKACTVVAADNVAAYLESTGQFGDWKAMRELPNVAPPLRDMFVEFRMGKPVGAIGWYFHAYDRQSDGYLPSQHDDGQARWLLRGWYYLEALPRQPQMMCDVFIRPDGQAHITGSDAVALYAQPTNGSIFAHGWENADGKQAGGIVAALIIALWTLCFMHTKNVSIDTVTPDAKLSKAHQKRGHEPLSVYKVLRITPMGSGRSDGAGEGKHASPSMHIRRGHFKHYNEGNGLLFGKYEGVYWWEQRLVGNRTQGTVQKEYEVLVP